MASSTHQQLEQQIVGYTKVLKPFALNLTRNEEESEDLIQDTVFRALSNLDKFAEGTNLKAWLFTIMKNIFINNYRRKMKRNTINDHTANSYYLNSGEETISNGSERSFLMQNIQSAMRDVNPDYSIPFMMYYEGFKYHEIAEKLELPLGTVKSRIFFARKELKNSLKQMGITSSKI
jgi:RNA polymerase sigma-70 factor (ECF subfamily)